MSADTAQAATHQAPAGQRAPVVRLRGVGAEIEGRRVLSGIDLELVNGEVIGLVGGNGVGKSTLIRLIARLQPLHGGEMDLLGTSFSGRSLSTPAQVRARIGVVGHGLMLYRDLTVSENLRFHGRLFGVRDIDDRVAEVLGAFGLENCSDRCVKSLSRGTAQRVAIARAVVHEPDLLLADEPFTGLDHAGAAALEGAIERVHARGGTVLVSDHDLGRCLRVCGRVVALHARRVILQSPTAELGETRLARAVQEGLA